MSPTYTLMYWPSIPGRGEFIRLAFEYTNTPYKEVKSSKDITSYLSPKGQHFAPPILDIDGHTISQTSTILAYLAPKVGLGGASDIDQARILQLTQTALDLSNEAHDTHHPIAVKLYYEDQKNEALLRASDFRETRIPKFLTHFETVLARNGTGVLVGSSVTIADLTLFQVVDGIEYAFPRRMAVLRKESKYEAVFALKDKLAKELEGYLKSERRCAYGQGIFRHYPELDGE